MFKYFKEKHMNAQIQSPSVKENNQSNIHSQGRWKKLKGFANSAYAFVLVPLLAFAVYSNSNTLSNVVSGISLLSAKTHVQAEKILELEVAQQNNLLQLFNNDENIANKLQVQQIQMVEQQLQINDQQNRISNLEASLQDLVKLNNALSNDNKQMKLALDKVMAILVP